LILGKPGAFNDMKNAFEICHWLVMERPDILTMANQITHALNTSLDPYSVDMATVTAQPTKSAPQEEKALARLWHEEIKCLFLRCRAPSNEAIEILVKKFSIMTSIVTMRKRSFAIQNEFLRTFVVNLIKKLLR